MRLLSLVHQVMDDQLLVRLSRRLFRHGQGEHALEGGKRTLQQDVPAIVAWRRFRRRRLVQLDILFYCLFF